MSNARYVKCIKVALLKWLVINPFIKVANDFKSVWRQQPLYVSDDCLTVWWPWDRSCFSVSRTKIWCMGWTGSGSGGCCPWWSFCHSCDIRCCRCPGGQVGPVRPSFLKGCAESPKNHIQSQNTASVKRPATTLSSVRAPEWGSGLRHCISVLQASLQTLVWSWAISQPGVIGSPIG